MISIRFCKKNFDKGSEKVAIMLKENHSDLELKIKSCIGHCKACSHSPIALIDKKVLIESTSSDSLYESIEDMIK